MFIVNTLYGVLVHFSTGDPVYPGVFQSQESDPLCPRQGWNGYWRWINDLHHRHSYVLGCSRFLSMLVVRLIECDDDVWSRLRIIVLCLKGAALVLHKQTSVQCLREHRVVNALHWAYRRWHQSLILTSKTICLRRKPMPKHAHQNRNVHAKRLQSEMTRLWTEYRRNIVLD